MCALFIYFLSVLAISNKVNSMDYMFVKVLSPWVREKKRLLAIAFLFFKSLCAVVPAPACRGCWARWGRCVSWPGGTTSCTALCCWPSCWSYSSWFCSSSLCPQSSATSSSTLLGRTTYMQSWHTHDHCMSLFVPHRSCCMSLLSCNGYWCCSWLFCFFFL